MSEPKVAAEGQEHPQSGSTSATGGGSSGGHPADVVMQSDAVMQAVSEAELAEYKDRVIRLQADLENARKRFQRELTDELRYAQLPLLRDLMQVADNLGRALGAAESAGESRGLVDGVKLVAKDLDQVLVRYHCQRIEGVGEGFNPDIQQAVGQQASADHPPQTVLQVVQPGYRLHERVVRPALVIVSSAG